MLLGSLAGLALASPAAAGGVFGIGSNAGKFSKDVQQYLSRLLIFPTDAQANAIAAFIDGCVADGSWARLDGCYLGAINDPSTPQINMISAKWVCFLDGDGGEPLWTPDRGYTGGGANTNLTSAFDPTTAGGRFSRNSACLFGWSLTASVATNQGLVGDQNNIGIWPSNSGGAPSWGLNSQDEAATATPADLTGFWYAERTGPNATTLSRNGVQLGVSNSASTALDDSNLQGPRGAYQLALWGFGAALGPLAPGFYARAHALMRALGATAS